MRAPFLLPLAALLFFTACDSGGDDPLPDEPITFVDAVVGAGAEARPYTAATVTYKGFLAKDSTLFDQGSFTFAVDNGEVVPGFNDGVKGMKVGGRRHITVPPSQGYGRKGYGSIIPGMATLLFEVTLTDLAAVTIEEITAGTGEVADAKDRATVAYTGTLVSGTVFDEGSFTYTVDGGQVIAGFNAGVRGMKKGGKRRVTVPPALGYGAQSSVKIPANSTLVFEVSLTELSKR